MSNCGCNKSFYHKQFYSQNATLDLQILPNGSFTIDVDSYVQADGQVELELIMNSVYPASSTPSTVGLLYNFQSDGVSITGDQYLYQSFVPPSANAYYDNNSVIFHDKNAVTGKHKYSVTITNTGLSVYYINSYLFLVALGNKQPINKPERPLGKSGRAVNKSRTIQSNQVFTPINSVSATIPIGEQLDLPVNIDVEYPNQVGLELNLSLVLSTSSSPVTINGLYEFFQDEVSLTGKQILSNFTFGVVTIPYSINNDNIFFDKNVTIGPHIYKAVIYNASSIPVNLNNYSFVVKNAINKNPSTFNTIEIFTPSNIYQVLSNVPSNNTYPITQSVNVVKYGQVLLEFNVSFKILNNLFVSSYYSIWRDGVQILSNQPFINFTPFIFPFEENFIFKFVDETASVGNHVYTMLLTNDVATSLTNVNIDNFVFDIQC